MEEFNFDAAGGIKNANIREQILLTKDDIKNRSKANEYFHQEYTKYVRAASKVMSKDKKECAVCGSKNINNVKNNEIENENDIENAKPLYYHHLFKVEHMATLFEKYQLIKRTKQVEKACRNSEKTGKKEYTKYMSYPRILESYTFTEKISPYYPGVVVCEEDHNLFHELIGDKKLEEFWKIESEKVYDIANNIANIFKDRNLIFDESMRPKDSDNKNVLEDYKMNCSEIWDKTIEKSLLRLDVVLKTNEFINNGRLYFDDDSLEKNTGLSVEQVIKNIESQINKARENMQDEEMSLPRFEKFSEKEVNSIVLHIKSAVDKRRGMPEEEDLKKFEDSLENGKEMTNQKIAYKIFEEIIDVKNYNVLDQDTYEVELFDEIDEKDLELLSNEELNEICNELGLVDEEENQNEDENEA